MGTLIRHIRREPIEVAALALAQLVSWGTLFYGFSLFVLPMERELGWSRANINGALSLGLLVSGLCAFSVGRGIDRHGGRAIMSGGSLLAGLLLLLWSLTDTLAGFYLLWCGLGVALSCTLYDPVFAVLTHRYPAAFRRYIIALTLVGGLASTVFIPLIQTLLLHWPWRSTLLMLAAAHILLCLPIHWLALRPRPAPAPATLPVAPAPVAGVPAPSGGLQRALRHPTFWALMLSFTAYYFLFAALTFHLVPLLSERGVAVPVMLAALALIGPAQVVARLGLLLPARPPPTALTGTVVMAVLPLAILLLVLFPYSLVALFMFVLLYGGANGMATIVRGTAAADLLWPQDYGAMNGLLALPANLAKAAGPVAAALIWMHGGYHAVLWVLVGIAMLACASFAYAVWRSPWRAAGIATSC
jgi:MFS family permease